LTETGLIQIRLPRDGGLDQDEEWCDVELDGEWRRFRFHDYADIYAVPGLYEQLFYRELECCSPATVAELLVDCLGDAGVDPAGLRLLDVGAGNGMVGEELDRLGVGSIVGLDILPAAAEATGRDRPGVYDRYLVADLTDLDPADRGTLEDQGFNAMTCVAALGFGDIPPQAFSQAFDLVEEGGWIAFNIKEDFLERGEDSGFAGLVRRLRDGGALELVGQKAYRHRLSAAGEPLRYVAMIGRKARPS
jgi:predicted TPR repeat methyltransferase